MIWNERIKNLRLQYAMTLKDVAEKLGVSEATIQRYESDGIKAIPYKAIEGLADLFGCSPCYIMGWSEIQSPMEKLGPLSETEISLVQAYRKAPESRREAVRALLNVQKKGNEESEHTASGL